MTIEITTETQEAQAVSVTNPQTLLAEQELLRRGKIEAEIRELEQKRDRLVERLDAGVEAIEKARVEGKNVTSFEDFWISLLRQYEQACDKIRDLHAEL